jgi:hypothetical protein
LKEHSAKEIITSRLLVLQSKRLMLRNIERRLKQKNDDTILARKEKLRADVVHAHDLYRTTMLTLGSPEHAGYWVVAYSSLIGKANGLTAALRTASEELPVAERYEASSDVEMLEHIVGGWTQALRNAMAESVA